MMNNSPYAMSDRQFFGLVSESTMGHHLTGGALAERVSNELSDARHFADLKGHPAHAFGAATMVSDGKAPPFTADELIDGANVSKLLDPGSKRKESRITLSVPKNKFML
ncbi:MAG: hypothetical protein EOM37_06260 [Proteobacteria bacterium]|jgi:hypothetical protein|nr:hypothetical protein [Alphaproteobacteria bacterium]NCC03634.1 hypothetical protein [Pseudomonadota bacterium]